MISSPPTDISEQRADDAEWQTEGLVSNSNGPKTISRKHCKLLRQLDIRKVM